MAKLIAEDLQPMLEAPGEARAAWGTGKPLGAQRGSGLWEGDGEHRRQSGDGKSQSMGCKGIEDGGQAQLSGEWDWEL